VTAEEIRAIEGLRERGRPFVYGTAGEGEAFYGEDGEIRGYAALLCGWLTGFFGIPFTPGIYDPAGLSAGLESGEVDLSGGLFPDFFLEIGNPDLAPLVPALRKYLDQGGDRHITALRNQGAGEYRRRLFFTGLTEDEREYIRIHQASGAIIPVAVRYDNYPASFYNETEKQWQGIALDILEDIENLTGMAFAPANKKTDEWFTVADMLEAHHAPMACDLSLYRKREGAFISAGVPYQTDHYAFLSRADYPDVGVNEVWYSRVAIVKDSSFASLFGGWFPGHTRTMEYPAILEAIDALDRGEVDLLLTTTNVLFMITNYQEKTGFKANLVLDEEHEYYFSFNREEEVLASVITRAQGFVDTGKIAERWTHRVFDYRGKMARVQVPYFIWLSAMLAAILVLLAVIYVRSKQEAKRLETVVRERTRELEVQTLRANAASEAKSRFVASMSHEIRTPMNAIIGMSDLMRTDNLDAVQQGYFTDIRKMAKSLLQIINDILDFSKIEAGKLEIIPVHFNILGLYDNICSMSRFTAQAKELEFRSGIDPKIPEALYGDEIRIRQIVTNIVNNAIKYTPAGSVSLAVNRVLHRGQDCLEFVVEDTGIGIREKDIPKLFESFHQLDREKNRSIVGTGLGLAITKELVSVMGGEIGVKSVYGKGTVFTVYLPLTEGDLSKIERKGTMERVTATDTVTVLVVDDNPINLTVAQGFLATHNIFPDTARSGPEAIEKICSKRYDLVFMDHMMPGMDGIEAVKVIRELNPSVLPAEIPDLSWFKNMPIVALSANAVSGAREAFLDAGMNDFISKPIDAESLNAALLKWLPPEKVTMIRQGKPGEWGTEYDALFKELKKLEILNLTAGLSHVGNNEAAYVQILRQFCVEFDGYVRDIERLFGEENWTEYTIKIHAIKGVFANIGAEAVSKWAYQLEYAARNGDYAKCLEETESFIGRMTEFRGKLLATSLMDKGEKKEKRRVESAELLRILTAVRTACGQGISDDADALTETLKGMSYSKTADAAIDELCGLIDSLDYDLAVKKAAAIEEMITEQDAIQ
jgi:signal transduction histidine kinase/CheY-like chemotaxis protein/HPt (histidine-containing phosphotransfer) domain-containing protein